MSGNCLKHNHQQRLRQPVSRSKSKSKSKSVHIYASFGARIYLISALKYLTLRTLLTFVGYNFIKQIHSL